MASPATNDVGELLSENSSTTGNGTPLSSGVFKDPVKTTAGLPLKNDKLLPKVPSHGRPVSKSKIPRLDAAKEGLVSATAPFNAEISSPSDTHDPTASDSHSSTAAVGLSALMGGATAASLSPKEAKRFSPRQTQMVTSQSKGTPLMEFYKRYVLDEHYNHSATSTKLGEKDNEALKLELLETKQELFAVEQQLLIIKQQREKELTEKGEAKNQVEDYKQHIARLERSNHKLSEVNKSLKAKIQNLKEKQKEQSKDSKRDIQRAMFELDLNSKAVQVDEEKGKRLQVECSVVETKKARQN